MKNTKTNQLPNAKKATNTCKIFRSTSMLSNFFWMTTYNFTHSAQNKQYS